MVLTASSRSRCRWTTKAARHAAEDIGRCALGVLRRNDLIGKTVGIAGEHLTGSEMAESLTRALGQPVRYHAVSPEAYRSFGFPGADDSATCSSSSGISTTTIAARAISAFSRSLNPQLETFDAWLAAHKNRFRGSVSGRNRPELSLRARPPVRSLRARTAAAARRCRPAGAR